MSDSPENSDDDNGWHEYNKLIMYRLDENKQGLANLDKRFTRLENSVNIDLDDIKNKIGDVRTDISNLKGRAAVWGSVAGFVVAFISSLILKMFGN